MSFIRRIPLPASALALGAAGLGNLLLPYSPAVRTACGAVAALLTILVALRIALDFAAARAELQTPGALAVLPTLFMAAMVLATYVKPAAPAAAQALWLGALALQLLVVALFVTRFVVGLKLEQVLPSWFLVFVGFVIASVTSPAFGMQPLGRVLFFAGLLGYLVALPIVVTRVTRAPLPAPAVPTIAIFAAPPSLLLVGYLAVTEAKQLPVVYALLGAATISVLFVLASLPRIFKVRFCASHAALTFPFVISAIALKQTNLFLVTATGGSFIPQPAIVAMDALATVMVGYVLVRYVLLVAAPAPVAAQAPAPAASEA